jgi:hypothetical protein
MHRLVSLAASFSLQMLHEYARSRSKMSNGRERLLDGIGVTFSFFRDGLVAEMIQGHLPGKVMPFSKI